MSGTLAGRRVLNTRAVHQAPDLDAKLRAAGAIPTSLPCIAIEPVSDSGPLDAALRAAIDGVYDWVLFTSANTVRAVGARLHVIGRESWMSAPCRLAVVGHATGAAVEQELGRAVNLVPRQQDAFGLAAALPIQRGEHVLIPGSSEARPELAETLRARGAVVTVVTAYEAAPVIPPTDIGALLNFADAVIFASPSAVQGFAERMAASGLQPEALVGRIVACIGPTTLAAAAAARFPSPLMAAEPSLDGIIDLLQTAFAFRRQSHAMIDQTTSPTKGTATYPLMRMRRLRRAPALRELVRETVLTPSDLILPLFVRPGTGEKRPINSMPGQFQWSVDTLAAEVREIAALGIRSVMLFGIPSDKDPHGSENAAPNGIVPTAIRAIKETVPEMVVISDMCFCEYTDHGHCGIINQPGAEHYRPELESGYLLNDPTLDALGRASVVHASAGADIIAPSGMLDGMVRAIRDALDQGGYDLTPVMSYAVKFASGFYGPFRDAAESPPAFGDRSQYQMDPANGREAVREALLDLDEGADLLIVKPALPYLDVLREVRRQANVPIAAYQVSGEYAMLHAAAANGWLDLERCAMESLTSIKRAGADMILTYFAKDVVTWLNR